jgi:threonine 3-dehydrogenase
MATMHGISKAKAEEGLWWVEAPVPKPGPDDALIRVKRSSICGTDVHIYKWDRWAQKTIKVPMIIGHEFCGEIVELGSNVTRPLHKGQRVSAEGHIVDLNSTASRAGKFHLDPNTKGLGVDRQGAWAEYVCIPAFNVVPLPDEVSWDLGSMLDPLGNAVHTAQQFDLLGEDVLITGAGPIGIMSAAVARRAGARSVVITDQNDFRLELAGKIAADVRTVNVTREELKDVMAQEKIENGFGVALEMAGAPAAIQQAIDALAMGGKLAMLGLPSKGMEVFWSPIIMKALQIKGVYGREMFETWRKMFGLIRGGLNLDPLITHRIPAAEFQKGFDAIKAGNAGKVVMSWD